ncbi:TMM81 protein, partial [Nyctibius bracteatus]|nr:TMM81 protein [Nyctibius bracteatus]
MKTLENSHILGILSCAFYLLLVVSSKKLTIPEELRSMVAKIVVNTTSCSKTCGLGFKLEQLCQVTATGERRNCALRRTACLTSWICGLLHFTVPVGKPFQLSCLTSEAAGFGRQAYNCMWRLAQGLITTNDLLFKPLKNPDSVIRFSPARESDAGTYRCDVQMVKTFKVVQRVYFGVRVIRNDLVDLNFQKSLTSEQKLAAKEEEGSAGNATHEEVQEQQHFWQGELFHECLVGAGSGVMGGVLATMALYFWQKVLRK